VNPDQGGAFYLAIKYKEVSTRPIRVQPAGCGCDDAACEFSRLRDGFEITALNQGEYNEIAPTPPTGSERPKWQELFQPPRNDNPACWCPKDPWVVLAKIEVGEEGKITKIDNCGEHRRLVAALGGFHWSCANVVRIISISDSLSFPNGFRCGESGQTPIMLQGDNNLNTLYLTGMGFQSGIKVDFGPGITVNVRNQEPDLLIVEARVSENAPEVVRDVVVTNPDCSTAFCTGSISVPPKSRDERARRVTTHEVSRAAETPQAPSRGRAPARPTRRRPER
jgi:hypothetical protein